MTREEWAKLAPEEQRAEVALLCGYTFHPDNPRMKWSCNRTKINGGIFSVSPPDYLNDLNAMHEAVETLREKSGPEWFDFGAHLATTCGSTMNCINATAAQRAEALVLTMEGE